MTQPIAAQPSTSVRDPETASRVIEGDTPKQAEFWSPGQDASFDEVLNSINPMHHIPVVSTIYRAVTGDTIGFGPRLIGAAILGGPVGLIIAGITAFIEEMSGGTISEHVAALFEGPTGDGEPATGGRDRRHSRPRSGRRRGRHTDIRGDRNGRVRAR